MVPAIVMTMMVSRHNGFTSFLPRKKSTGCIRTVRRVENTNLRHFVSKLFCPPFNLSWDGSLPIGGPATITFSVAVSYVACGVSDSSAFVSRNDQFVCCGSDYGDACVFFVFFSWARLARLFFLAFFLFLKTKR
jgi:hypothetical protein